MGTNLHWTDAREGASLEVRSTESGWRQDQDSAAARRDPVTQVDVAVGSYPLLGTLKETQIREADDQSTIGHFAQEFFGIDVDGETVFLRTTGPVTASDVE